MKKQFSIIFLSLSLALLISSCYYNNVKDQKSSNFTMGKVKMEIKKGVTSQSDILSIFGAPNLVTKNKSDNEVWNYSKMSYESAYGSESAGLILWGGSRSLSSTSSKSFDLIIIFDENDLVKEYSVIASSF